MEELAGVTFGSIPSGTSKEDFVLFLKNHLLKGTDMKYVLYPLSGNHTKAFVCFASMPDELIGARLVMHNHVLTVTPNQDYQMYNRCSADVDDVVVVSIPDIPHCISMLQQEFGIKAYFSDDTGKLKLEGSLLQLDCAQRKLQEIFLEQQNLQRLEIENIMQRDVGNWKYDEDEWSGPMKEDYTKMNRYFEKEGDPQLSQYRERASGTMNRIADEPEPRMNPIKDVNPKLNWPDGRSLGHRTMHEPRLHERESSGTSRLSNFEESRKSQSSHTFSKTISTDPFREYQPASLQAGSFCPRERRDSYPSNYPGGGSPDMKAFKGDVSRTSAFDNNRAGLRGDLLSETQIKVQHPSLEHWHQSSDLPKSEHPSVMQTWEPEFRRPDTSIKSRKYLDPRILSSTDRSTNCDAVDPFVSTSKSSSFIHPSDEPRRDRGIKEKPEDEMADEIMLSLDSNIVRYITDIKKIAFDNILRRHHADFKLDSIQNSDIVMLTFMNADDARHSDLKSAAEEFTELYEQVFQSVIQQSYRVDLKSKNRLDELIQNVQKDFRHGVVITKETSDSVLFVGEFENVGPAIKTFERLIKVLEDDSVDNDKEHLYPLDRKLSSEHLSLSFKDNGFESKLEDSIGDRLKNLVLCDQFSDEHVRSTAFNPVIARPEHLLDRYKRPSLDAHSLSIGRDLHSKEHVKFKNGLIVDFVTGDITRLAVEGIVNAANSYLMNYAGVASAIERAGGDRFKMACEELVAKGGPLEVSEVRHTPSYGDLSCKYVLHAVGPIWTTVLDQKSCAVRLEQTFKNILDYSDKFLKLTSVAIPAISSGIFGIPIDLCARSSFSAIVEFANKTSADSTLKHVYLVNNDETVTEMIQVVFEQLMQQPPVPAAPAGGAYKTTDLRTSSSCSSQSDGQDFDCRRSDFEVVGNSRVRIESLHRFSATVQDSRKPERSARPEHSRHHDSIPGSTRDPGTLTQDTEDRQITKLYSRRCETSSDLEQNRASPYFRPITSSDNDED